MSLLFRPPPTPQPRSSPSMVLKIWERKHQRFTYNIMFDTFKAAPNPITNTLRTVIVTKRIHRSVHPSQVARPGGACPSFHGIKRLGVSLLPPGWVAGPSQCG